MEMELKGTNSIEFAGCMGLVCSEACIKLLVSCKMHPGRFGALPHSYLYFAFCKLTTNLQSTSRPNQLHC